LYSIHDAVTQAGAGGEDVWIAAGDYLIGSAINMQSDVALYGGFPSTGNPGFGDRDPSQHVTTMDGQDAAANLIVCDNVSNVRIDGLTLKRSIEGGSGYARCGAICCTGGSTSVTVENCIIEGNYGPYGGGMNIHESSATVTRCEFRYNTAGEGGGLKLHTATASIISCAFHHNRASDGGAIYGYNSYVTVSRCAFTDNTTSRSAGALAFGEGHELNITNCLIARNQSASYGGAISMGSQANNTISNCTIVDNTAPQGGGVSFHSCAATIANTVFVDNNHHAIFEIDSGQNIAIKNCLFFRNSDGVLFHEGSDTIIDVTGPSGLNYLLTEAEGNIAGDPMFVNPAVDNYHLRFISPCIDAGTGESAPTDDFDGETRPIGTGYDIGFDELLDSDGDGMPDWWEQHDGLLPLVDDAGGDADGDLLTNGEEYLHDTNPQIADTDGDGHTDREEIVNGTDPRQLLRDPVFVSKTGNNTTGDSWATALHSLHDAVASASDQGKDVWVAADTYYVGSPIVLQSNVAVYGGFPSSGGPIFCDRDPAAHLTTLDGQGAVTHVILCDDVYNVGIDGCTITGGSADDAADWGGGGVACFNGSLGIVIENCVLTNNTGLYACAVAIKESVAEMLACQFSNNSGYEGGGFQVWRGHASVHDSLFDQNSSTALGGGVSSYESQLEVNRCTFLDNASGKGGAIECHEGYGAAIANCLIVGNEASLHGGALNFEFQSGIKVANCTLVNNSADDRAGGVLFHSSQGSILNTILVGHGNHAIYENDTNSDPTVRNCLFYNNPDGVYFNEGLVTIADATGPDGINALLAEADGNIEGNPRFVNATAGDYHIALLSPCVDAGTASGAPSTDIDCESRPVDVPDKGADGTGTEYDIGADEIYDTDHDGVRDDQDAFPRNPRGATDSDGDGIGDEWEDRWFGNNNDVIEPGDLTAAGEGTDYDGDDCLDITEFIHGSDPTDPLSFVPAVGAIGLVLLTVTVIGAAAYRRREPLWVNERGRDAGSERRAGP
jgi:hypothetical protein